MAVSVRHSSFHGVFSYVVVFARTNIRFRSGCRCRRDYPVFALKGVHGSCVLAALGTWCNVAGQGLNVVPRGSSEWEEQLDRMIKVVVLFHIVVTQPVG